MFRIVFYLTLSLIAALVAPGMAQEAAKEQQACLAKRPDQAGELDGRIAACLAVIGNSVLPNDIRSEAYLRRASAYAEKAAQSNSKDHIDRAIADLSEGLRLDSDNIFAQKYVYLTRAGLYLQEGDYEQAIRDYTDFIRLEPNSATTFGYRGVIYATKGEPEKAVADFTEAIRLDPRAWLIYNQRAWSYMRVGKVDDALADANRAVELAPNDAASYSARVVINRTLGKTADVIGDLRKALSLDPSNEGIKEELRLAEATQPAASMTEAKIVDTKVIEQAKAEVRKAQEAAKAAEQRLVALETASAATAAAPKPAEGKLVATDPEQLARALQTELKRVGCDPGAIDGRWGKNAQSALQKFASRTKVVLPADPTAVALDAVSAQQSRVCPLECDGDEREVNGKCVTKPRSKKVRSAQPSEPSSRRSSQRGSVERDSGSSPGAGSISIGIGGRGGSIGFGIGR